MLSRFYLMLHIHISATSFCGTSTGLFCCSLRKKQWREPVQQRLSPFVLCVSTVMWHIITWKKVERVNLQDLFTGARWSWCLGGLESGISNPEIAARNACVELSFRTQLLTTRLLLFKNKKWHKSLLSTVHVLIEMQMISWRTKNPPKNIMLN